MRDAFTVIGGFVRVHWRGAFRAVLQVAVGVVMLVGALAVVGAAIIWLEALSR